MIKKMIMDDERLNEVLGFAKISLPKNEFPEVLDRVNAVLRMCDEMQELEHDHIEPFEWDVQKIPALREDKSVEWDGRNRFLDQAPVREGDFFKVPRIIALENDGPATDLEGDC